jgi:hypothetical protein
MKRSIPLLILSTALVSAAIAQDPPGDSSPRKPERASQPAASPPTARPSPTPARRRSRGAELPRRSGPLDPRRPDPVTPSWSVGQWWEVAADLAVERAPRGLTLALPEAKLPGLGRRGPRRDYREVARWRFRVAKSQRFKVPGSNDGSWHLGWFVEVRRIDREARQPSAFTLVFVGGSKALSDIGVLHSGRKIRWLSYDADAILEPPIEPALQLLPLAWPDLRGARRLEGRGHKGESVLQRRKSDRSGVYFELRPGGPEGGAPPVRVRWRAGEPWPVRISGRGFALRLLRTGPAGSERR